MKVLVIEDDKEIIDTIMLSFLVGLPGTDILSTPEGREGIEMTETEKPDIVILDIGLPDISGFDVLKEIRGFSDVPIIILTAMTEENDIIRCLEWGADDFISKPFSKMELLARVKTKTRRVSSGTGKDSISHGDLRYAAAENSFYYKDTVLDLTLTESEILYTLIKEAGNVVRYSSLAEALWGDDAGNCSGSLKVHIHHLREKLKKCSDSDDTGSIIQTWSGLGYSLETSDRSMTAS